MSGDSHRNPLASANLPYRITVVRQILDLQVVVRIHMEFVAQLVERQVVALVVVGSIPFKLPNASIAQW